MELRFLGTGAADWNGTDERGEQRRYTSTLFDHSLLIDFTSQARDMLPKNADIRRILITHSHIDHFDPEAIAALAPADLYAHESWAGDIHIKGITVHAMKIEHWTRVGEFEVMALPANHSTGKAYEQPIHYLLRKGEKTVLYATDGAWLLNSALHLMRGISLCGMVIDATIGDGHEGDYRIFEHNSIPMIRIMVDTLLKTRLLQRGAPVFLTHMARTLHPSHREIAESLPEPYRVCFDGMEITL